MSSDEQTSDVVPQTPERRPSVANEPPPVRRPSRESMDIARKLLEQPSIDEEFIEQTKQAVTTVARELYKDGVVHFHVGLLLALVLPKMAKMFLSLCFLFPVLFLWGNMTQLHAKYSFRLPARESKDDTTWGLVWAVEVAFVAVGLWLLSSVQ